MYHSVTFGDKNTWDDWHLVPTSRPLFNPPSVKSNIIDIPGGNGSIDLSEELTGEPLFGDRSGSMEFIVVNDYISWEKAYSTIMNYLHGRRMHAILEDDPGFYYDGRFSVNQWRSDKAYSLITINYQVAPYKKRTTTSLEPWLWDPFNFETGIITVYSDIPIRGTVLIRVYGDREIVTPIFKASAPMTMVTKGKTYSLPKGDYKNEEIKLYQGLNEFSFTGEGTISIEYRGGSL